MADAEYRAEAWAESVAHSQLAVSLARDADQRAHRGMVNAAAAFPLAAQGDWDAAEAHVAASRQGAEEMGDVANILFAGTAGARLAQARGDAAASPCLGPVRALGDADGVSEPGIQPWTTLWAEALIATGRHDDAEEVIADLARRLARRSHPTDSVRLARLRGLLALAQKRLADADTILAEGAEVDPQCRDPLERSLLLIALGAVRRRLGQRRAASACLDAAAVTLVELGATPFLERCRREQAACGLDPTPRRERAHDRLTPQERAVATLVVSGMSNREVAEELIVSVKTVEYHLGNIYAKLGVSSRGRLAAKLSARAQRPDRSRCTMWTPMSS